MPFAQFLWLEVFVVKKVLSHLKERLNQLPWKPKCVMWSSFGQAFKKLISRLLVQEKHGFLKGARCAPLAAGAQKKPGLDRVYCSSSCHMIPILVLLSASFQCRFFLTFLVSTQVCATLAIMGFLTYCLINELAISLQVVAVTIDTVIAMAILVVCINLYPIQDLHFCSSCGHHVTLVLTP